MDIKSLYNEFKLTLSAEICAMREALGISHQTEYAILCGDEELKQRLNRAANEAYNTLYNIQSHRQQLLNQLASALNCNAALEDELWLTLQYYDIEDCECQSLIEQVQLLDDKIDDQSARNESLLQAVDTRQLLPQEPHGIAFQPIPLKRGRRSVMITVDFPDDMK